MATKRNRMVSKKPDVYDPAFITQGVLLGLAVDMAELGEAFERVRTQFEELARLYSVEIFPPPPKKKLSGQMAELRN